MTRNSSTPDATEAIGRDNGIESFSPFSNRNTHDISTDLMLRVLGSLGVQAKLQFRRGVTGRSAVTSSIHL